MSRHILALSHAQLTSCNLEAFVAHAATLNQHNRKVFTTPFPKAPRRWLSHYEFIPRSIALTSEGDVDGGRSWLVGATLDCSFTRALWAPYDGTRGGSCYDPASLVVLEVAAKVDQYVDDAKVCDDLHQSDKGCRYRQLAGLNGPIPDQEDLCHFRYRVGDEVIEQIMAVAVDFLYRVGLLKGELLRTDGQLESSYSRYKGCAYACEDCQAFELREADRQALGAQLHSGAKRLQRTCPFPEVVKKVRKATTKTGHPKDPTVSLLAIKEVPHGSRATADRQQVAALLDLPEDAVPPVRLTWCHVRQGPQGNLWGCCPKVPADLEAKVGHHVDTQNPSKKAEVFGYVHLKTTDLNGELGLELPLGNTTYAADANEGTHFIAHRQSLAIPLSPGQVQLGDAADDSIANDAWLHDHGGIAVFAYNQRNEHLDPESLVNRGYDPYGTPYAPCGRLCHANGYDYQGQRRQYVCGLQCPPEERQHCPHRDGVLGYCHRMTFKDYPRLIGPVQRGSKAWQNLYGARSASERTNSYDQEVIANAHPLRMRGLQAFRFAGALRTLAQLLRRAMNFVLDTTYTLGKALVAQT